MPQQPPAWAIAAARAAFVGRPHALPSVSLAQTIEESGWFTRLTGANNFGGIKAMAGHPSSVHATHELIGGVLKAVPCAFRDFASPAEYFAVHGDILEHGIACRDYRAALLAGGVFKAVYLLGGGTAARPRYATADATKYGDALASLIRDHQLTAFDHG